MVTPVVFHKKQNLKTPLKRLQLIKARQGCLKLASVNPATSVSLVVTLQTILARILRKRERGRRLQHQDREDTGELPSM